MFQQSKSSRTISLNSRYMILFRNERDKNQIKALAQQMQSPHLLLAYEDATSMDHSYLVVDFHSRTNKELRLRTDIFHRWYTEGDARGPIVYSSAQKEKTHFDIIHFHVTRRWVNMDIPHTSNSV